jgi:hypothetical protein
MGTILLQMSLSFPLLAAVLDYTSVVAAPASSAALVTSITISTLTLYLGTLLVRRRLVMRGV